MAGEHATELCEFAFDLFFTSETDRSQLDRYPPCPDCRGQTNTCRLLSEYIVLRRKTANGMLDRRVNYVLTRFSRHSQPTAPGGRTRGSMTSLYETHRLPLEQSTQSPPPEEGGAEGTRQAGFQGTYQKGGGNSWTSYGTISVQRWWRSLCLTKEKRPGRRSKNNTLFGSPVHCLICLTYGHVPQTRTGPPSRA